MRGGGFAATVAVFVCADAVIVRVFIVRFVLPHEVVDFPTTAFAVAAPLGSLKFTMTRERWRDDRTSLRRHRVEAADGMMLTLLDPREVKRAADFVAIVSRYTRLRRSGRQFVGPCPFHTERTPSFYVDPQRKLFKCFGRCDAGGDMFDFIMRAERCDFPSALRIAAGVARESEPRSGERFRGRVGGEAPSAREAGATPSQTEHARLVARLDATAARLKAIGAANEIPLACAAERAACEPRSGEPLFINKRTTGHE